MDDDFDDWDRDEVVDLDGCYGDVTGDPQLDVFGYQSPRRDMGPPPAPEYDWQAQAKRDQADIERRNARGAVGGPAVRPAGGLWRAAVRAWWRWFDAIGALLLDGPSRPATGSYELAPHVVGAVQNGAVGRWPGWYRVDVDAYGRSWWTPVDAPGDGPQMTVYGGQQQPVELNEPGPQTQLW